MQHEEGSRRSSTRYPSHSGSDGTRRKKRREDKYSDFLSQQSLDTMSSALPLRPNYRIQIASMDEEEEEKKEFVVTPEICEKAYKQRKQALDKYLKDRTEVIVIKLKTELPHKKYRPIFIKNIKPLSHEPPPLHRFEPSFKSNELSEPILTNDVSYGNKIESYGSDHSGQVRFDGRTDEEFQLDYEMTKTWLEAVEMDLDDNLPNFLTKLPDLTEYKRMKESGETEEFELGEDPVQEALQNALKIQQQEDDDRLDDIPPQAMTAEEINIEWGFKENSEVGKYIRKYKMQLKAGEKPKKKQKKPPKSPKTT